MTLIEDPDADALSDVGRERFRQVAEEGFTLSRDLGYHGGEMAAAAAALALAYAGHPSASSVWPASWTPSSMKVPPMPPSPGWRRAVDPVSRESRRAWRRTLVKAAALLVAEIAACDSLDAMPSPDGGGEPAPGS